MSSSGIFVGRKAELEQFKQVLEGRRGQAVLVVGQGGMGKTWLVNKMARIAENHPDLKCGWVRYEVTPTDTVDATMALMMDNAFEAANAEPGSFDKVPLRRRQWLALVKAMVPKGGDLAELIGSLRRDPQRNTREQFLDRLRLICDRMLDNGRAIFIVDPEKYMQKDSDQSWAIVVKQLPEKVKFIFAQRPEDQLIKGRAFKGLENSVCIPGGTLAAFDESDVDELLQLRAGDVGQSEPVLRGAVERYQGHPYAVQAALDIVGKTGTVEGLPQDPTPEAIAQAQWERTCETGDDAIRLFEAYAILEVGVPNDVVEAVSGQDAIAGKRLQSDSYLRGLLREEGTGLRIYHAILADHILGQIGQDQKKEYHSRAVVVYRGKLAQAEKEQTRPDALAAVRLSEHVLATGGPKAFVDCFVNQCGEPLMNLGLLDALIGLSERALEVVEGGSEEEAALTGNLGLVYETRGELDKAEQMQNKSLEIAEKLNLEEGMAQQYGNLGVIYKTRGELDKAEEMHSKSLEIYEKLGRLEGMASQYGNLGLIYRRRGELDKAEEMHTKSVEIAEKLGRLDLMANQYGNLGLVYRTRGELDKAEEMHKKSLEIQKKLGRLEGIACEYGNLGLIYQMRGELDKAEEMHKKSLEIQEKLGLQEGMANSYGNLGLIYRTRGELDKAEEMHRKALQIDEKLGSQDGMASDYGNLGVIYLMRGELENAEEMLKHSLEIHEELGSQEGTANSYSNLGTLHEQRGRGDKARDYWEKALELYKKMGMPHMVEKVQGLIEGLG